MTNSKKSCKKCGNDIVPGQPGRCCKRAKDRAYYKRHRQRLLDYQKQYTADNRNKVLVRTRQWCEDNKDALKERRKTSWALHIDTRRRYENSLNGAIREGLARSKQQGARKRILESTITSQDIRDLWEAQDGLCALTGVPLETKRNSPKRLSVDRIDSNLGYTPDNIQLVCKWANMAKSAHGNEEFFALLDDLAGV